MGNNKLNRNAENILKMLNQKDPAEFAKWLDVILDDLASTIDNRAVCEFTFTEIGTQNFIASSCYVTPPAKGEYIKVNDSFYEVISVMHTFHRDTEPGSILVKKVDTNFFLD